MRVAIKTVSCLGRSRSALGCPVASAPVSASLHSSAVASTSKPPVIPVSTNTSKSLPVNHVYPPSAEASAAIIEAKRSVWGEVAAAEGGGERSGRKVLRQNLKGAALASYYPIDVLADLPITKLGMENPAVEDLWRRGEERARVGESLRKGKSRGPNERFLDRMTLEDKQDEILEQVDYFYPEDALPEEETIEALMEGMSEQEREWTREIFAKMVLDVERGRAERIAKAGAEIAKDDKKARARKVTFRQGLQDKRKKDEVERGGEAEEAPAAEAGAAEGTVEEKEAPSGLSEEDTRMIAEIQQLLQDAAPKKE